MGANDRYQCWAGIGHEKYLDVMTSILNGEGEEIWRKKVQEMRFETLWPIVDKETAGDIDGFPRPDQMLCFAFSPSDQEKICEALNLADSLRKMGEAGKEGGKAGQCAAMSMVDVNGDSLRSEMEKITLKIAEDVSNRVSDLYPDLVA